MIETILRGFLEHRGRKWIVTTVIFAIGLLVLWPLADEYVALGDQRRHKESTLANTQAMVAKLTQVRAQAQQKRDHLTELEGQVLNEANLQEYRQRVVQLIRDSGCQIRRINVGEAKNRPWFEKDQIHTRTKKRSRGKKTAFQLGTQGLSLSITGPLPGIKTLLRRLKEENKLVHTKSFAIHPATVVTFPRS